MLAVLREIYQGFGKQGLQRVSVTGIDIREILVKTAAVQIGANLVVQGIKENGGEPIEIGELLLLKGNALDPDEQWETIVHVGSQSSRRPLWCRPARTKGGNQ